MHILIALLGLVTLIGIGVLFSKNRTKIAWRTVAWGFGLQFFFALLILKTQFGKHFFTTLNDMIVAFLAFTREGARMVFGNLVDNTVIVGQLAANGSVSQTDNMVANIGSFLAFSVLPTIIFFSAFVAILYHLGVIQWLVRGMSWVMMRTMKTSGAETLSATTNIFIGIVEAPLVIRKYLDEMTESELMCIMTAGFATIAGGVMAAYVGILHAAIPDIAGHLMAASVMSAPAALALAKVFHPETETPTTSGNLKLDDKEKDTINLFDAATQGATQGVAIAINVAAMLIAFLGLVALVNGLLGWTGGLIGFESLNLAWLFGKLFAPLAWLLGVPFDECVKVGALLGTKMMINEFVAYLDLNQLVIAGEISERSRLIASYALCGFANLSSIGICLGGIGAIAPKRRKDMAKLALRAMFAGAFASFSTACIAGMLL